MSKTHPLLPPGFESKGPLEREKFFMNAADQVIKNETIRKPLADGQKESLRYALEKESIKLADLNEEYDAVKKSWRDTLDDQKERVAHILTQLRSGHETIGGAVYAFRDFENQRVIFFTADGMEIPTLTRPMLPDERQTTMQGSIRKVENE